MPLGFRFPYPNPNQTPWARTKDRSSYPNNYGLFYHRLALKLVSVLVGWIIIPLSLDLTLSYSCSYFLSLSFVSIFFYKAYYLRCGNGKGYVCDRPRIWLPCTWQWQMIRLLVAYFLFVLRAKCVAVGNLLTRLHEESTTYTREKQTRNSFL